MQIKDNHQQILSCFNKRSSTRPFVKKAVVTPSQTQAQHMFDSVIISRQVGFTLLELLVVTALLAIIAGVVIGSHDGVQDQATYDTTVYEMAELRKALLQFRRDSGSNDFPTDGIYSCTDPAVINIAELNDPSGSDTWPLGAPSADDDLAEWQDWCANPANFWMLFINPLDDINTADEEGGWNVDTRRGWNGPYLQRNVVYLDIGDDLILDGSGDPHAGSAIENIWGVASSYDYRPNSALLTWYPDHDSTTDEAFSRYGTPYLLFDLNEPDDDNPPRLVNLAADHDYAGDDESDCSQPTEADNPYPLDHVLCLLE